MTKTYEVNQAPALSGSKAAWDAWMAEHGGSMLNVSSVGGLGPEPGLGWYNVTKAAIIHLTRQLAYELGPKVRVNCPRPRRGAHRAGEGAVGGRGRGAAREAHLPLGRIGEPDDIASRRALSPQRRLVVDHRPDPGGGRRDHRHGLRWRELS